VHPIDQSSPLYGATMNDIINMRAEIIGVLDGIDETVSDNFQVSVLMPAAGPGSFHLQFMPRI
jgi:hypothetical protein